LISPSPAWLDLVTRGNQPQRSQITRSAGVLDGGSSTPVTRFAMAGGIVFEDGFAMAVRSRASDLSKIEGVPPEPPNIRPELLDLIEQDEHGARVPERRDLHEHAQHLDRPGVTCRKQPPQRGRLRPRQPREPIRCPSRRQAISTLSHTRPHQLQPLRFVVVHALQATNNAPGAT
jgi:hypothetical protein